jgi:hypothetical protein
MANNSPMFSNPSETNNLSPQFNANTPQFNNNTPQFNTNDILNAVNQNNQVNMANGITTMPPMPSVNNNMVNNSSNILELNHAENAVNHLTEGNSVSAEDWRSVYFEKIDCKGVAVNGGNGDVLVQGEAKSNTPNPTIVFWAPNPPTWSQSYSGSGLPYHDSIQAYEKSPNVGAVKAINRKFEFRIKFPNAYYVGLGSLYVPPVVHFKICEEGSDGKEYHTIDLGKGIPYRTLTYPAPPSNRPRDSPLFYYCSKTKLPVRTQEQVLRDSGYPEDNKMHDDFWGLRPPR